MTDEKTFTIPVSELSRDIYCISAKWDDPDDLNWGEVLFDTIPEGGELLDCGDSTVFICDKSKSFFLFSKDHFIFIGDMVSWTKYFGFVSIAHEFKDGYNIKLTMKVKINKVDQWASYLLTDFKYDKLESVAVDLPRFIVAYDLDTGDERIDWAEFMLAMKCSDEMEAFIMDKHNAVITGDARNSLWVLTNDVIVYIGHKELFMDADRVLTDTGEKIVIRNYMNAQTATLSRKIIFQEPEPKEGKDVKSA